MFPPDLPGNIPKYYLYQSANHLQFFTTVLILFLLSRGLSMAEVMWLQSIYALAIIFFEVPTGVIADKFGKRKSMVLGSLFFGVGLIWYGLGFHFWQFVIGEIIVAVGAAFISGADSAFIHETLVELGWGNRFRKVEGRAQGLAKASLATSALVGGLIGAVSLPLTLIASAGGHLMAAVSAGLSLDPRPVLPREEETNYRKIVVESAGLIRSNRRLLFLVLFYAIFIGISRQAYWFSQPYLKEAGLPVAFFGVIFFGQEAIGGLVSNFSQELDDRFGAERLFVLLTILSLVSMIAVGFQTTIWLVPLWIIIGAPRVIVSTIVSDRILKIVPPARAVTVISFSRLAMRLVYAPVGPVLGWVADRWELV